MSEILSTSDKTKRKWFWKKKSSVVVMCIALLIVGGIGTLLYQITHPSAPAVDTQATSKAEVQKQVEHYYKVTSVVKATLKQLNATKKELLVTLKDGSEKTVSYDTPLTVTRGKSPGTIAIDSVAVGTVIDITYDSEQNRALAVWIAK